MSYILQEIFAECQIILQTWIHEHRRVAIAVAAITAFLAATICWQICGFFNALLWPEPTVLRNFSGTIKYQDNSLIPARSMSIELTPINVSAKKTGPLRPGYLLVDCTSGTFSGTIQMLGQATAQIYRVTVLNAEGSPLPPNLVPEQFGRPHTSTLCIDVLNKKAAIQIPKPMSQYVPEFSQAQRP